MINNLHNNNCCIYNLEIQIYKKRKIKRKRKLLNVNLINKKYNKIKLWYILCKIINNNLQHGLKMEKKCFNLKIHKKIILN